MFRKEILNNVKLFLDYVYNQRKNFLYGIELFAGDLFYDNIYFDIIDILESFLKPIKKDYPELFDREILIMMPNNLNWVYHNPEKVEKFREYFYRFKKEYNTILSASWSTDGYYAMNTREKKILPESYFDTIFSFCKEFECGYHPMIAAENVHTWVQNYDWWIKKYEQFNLTEAGDFQPFMLMVRNNNWTDENINDYLVYGINPDDLKDIYSMLSYGIDRFYSEYKNGKNIIIQAHPMRDNIAFVKPESLDGIEVFNLHPNHNSRVGLAAKFARENNMIAICGSDFHHYGQECLCGILTKKPLKNSFDVAKTLKKRAYKMWISDYLINI